MTNVNWRGLAVYGLLLQIFSSACSSSPPSNPTPGQTGKSCSSNADCANKSFCSSGACVQDDAAPTLAVSAPVAGQVISSATFRLAGTADDGAGAGGVTVEWSTDGVAFQPATVAGTAFSADLPIPAADHAPLDVTVRAHDRLGNEAIQIVHAFADRVPPALAIQPPSGAVVHTAQVTVTGTVTDAGGGVSGSASLDGQTFTPITIAADGTFTVQLPVPAVDHQTVTVTVQAKDGAGNSVEKTASFTADRVGPTVAVTTPAANAVCSAATLTVQGTASDGGAVASMRATIDGTTYQPVTVGQGGAFSFDVALPVLGGNAVTLTLEATDDGGNVSTTTVPLIVARVAPVVTIALPTAGSIAGGPSSATVELAGTVTGGYGALTATYSTDGLVDIPLTLGAGGAFDVQAALPAGDFAPLSLHVSAKDALQRTGTQLVTINADRVKPTVVVTAPIAGASYAAVPITGTVTDGDPAVTATVSRNSGTPIPLVLGAGGAFSDGQSVGPLSDHIQETITVTATDRAGNVRAMPVTFYSDAVAPQLHVTSPVEGQSYGGPTIALTGTYSDGDPATKVRFQVDGGAFADAALSAGSFTASIPVATANHVASTVLVRAIDSAGNHTDSTIHVYFDTTKPVITFDAQSKQVQGPGKIAFSGTVSEPDLLSATYSFNGGASTALTVATDGTFSVSVDAPAGLDGVAVDFVVTAKDGAGNTASAKQTVTVDTVAPVLAVDGADGACPTDLAAPCTGMIVKASDTNAVITGTVADGYGPASSMTGTVKNGASVVFGPNPIAANGTGAWSFAWTGLPSGDDGVAYTVEVTAADAAGNQVTKTRTLWVDRVVPTIAATPAAGKRLYPVDGALVTFSEPMNAAAVRAATTFVQAGVTIANMGPIGSGGTSYGFPSGLANYKRYDVTIGMGATDRAGNPLAAASSTISFLTAIAPVFGTLTSATLSGDSPRIAIDPDGRPVIVARTLAGPPSLYRFDGTGTTWRGATNMPWPASGAQPLDLLLVGVPPAGSVDPYDAQVRLVVAVPDGTGGSTLQYAQSTNLSTWTGAKGAAGGDNIAPLSTVAAASFSYWFCPSGMFCLGDPWNVVYYDGSAVKSAGISALAATTWSIGVRRTTNTVTAQSGSGFVDSAVARFIDPSNDVAIATSATSASGRQTGAKAAYAASTWKSCYSPGIGLPLICSYGLMPACTADRTIATPTWSTPASGQTSAGALTGLETAISATSFAIAYQNGSDLSVGKIANNGCTSAPPVPSWTTVTGAKQPALAFGPDGTTLYYAFVTTSGTSSTVTITK
jgi:hypothetical protein